MAKQKTMPQEFDRPTYAAPFIKADHPNASYLGDPHVDNLMLVVYALSTELWAERERSRIVEALLERGEAVTQEAIQQYAPSDEEEALWKSEQDAMTKRVFSYLGRDTQIGRKFSEPRFKDRHKAR